MLLVVPILHRGLDESAARTASCRRRKKAANLRVGTTRSHEVFIALLKLLRYMLDRPSVYRQISRLDGLIKDREDKLVSFETGKTVL